VRGDHGVCKTILLGVWRVAANGIEGVSAAEAAKVRMIRPDGDTGSLLAITRKCGNPT
jgi:hypothetical protein